MVKNSFLLALMSIICTVLYPQTQFVVTLDANMRNEPVTGNLYILLSKDTAQLPIYGPDFIDPAPFFVKHVRQWNGVDALRISTPDAAYPVSLERLPDGIYAIQAVLDTNTVERSFSFASGNLYSKKIVAEFKNGSKNTVTINLDQRIKDRAFKETETIKGVKVKSALLSDFYKRPTYLEAAVILPPSYKDNADRKYPVVYVIPGFGGTHYNDHLGWVLEGLVKHAQQDKVYVVLNPESPLGHHVFADSQNNGPRAQALIKEFIPSIESRYPILAAPQARFLFGHSSGGWSSVWLMVQYPEFFGGAWSSAPDPLDFRSFFKINIYKKNVNAFVDENGNARKLERIPVEAKPTYQQLSDRELVLGDGEQYGSFEAVFSPQGKNGRPLLLWDRKTGKINPDVSTAWRKYDITSLLKQLPAEHLQKLNDKIYIYVGEEDTYYLDDAIRLFHEESKNILRSSVKFFSGEDHYSILNKAVYEDIESGMNKTFNMLAEAKR